MFNIYLYQWKINFSLMVETLMMFSWFQSEVLRSSFTKIISRKWWDLSYFIREEIDKQSLEPKQVFSFLIRWTKTSSKFQLHSKFSLRHYYFLLIFCFQKNLMQLNNSINLSKIKYKLKLNICNKYFVQDHQPLYEIISLLCPFVCTIVYYFWLNILE